MTQEKHNQQPSVKDVSPAKKVKRHWVRPRWLRRVLRTLLGLIIFILLIPVLVYVPFVQTWLKDIACSVVNKNTGMHVSIERLRIHFPLDVELQDVLVLTAPTDTMVAAKSLIADVKLMPLFKGDVQINEVELNAGRYNMVSADSSLTLKLQAGYLRVQGGSQFNLKTQNIRLRAPMLRDAIVSLDMDVYKQKSDTASKPTTLVIDADRLTLQNVNYRMTMLPTIANLDLHIGNGTLTGALIDLKNSRLHATDFECAESRAVFLTPTPEFVKEHPLPVDTMPKAPSAPFEVSIDKVRLGFDYALYGTQGARPLPGFDPSYIEVSDVALAVDSFYNCASTVRLPLREVRAKERSGLQVDSCRGLVQVDSLGLTLDRLYLATPNTWVSGSAWMPFAGLDALSGKSGIAPEPLSANIRGSLGWTDLFLFMPDMRKMLSQIAALRQPLRFDIDASGTPESVSLRRADLSIPGFLALKASGFIQNLMTPRRMEASVNLDGKLQDARVANSLLAKMVGTLGFKLPTFALKGHIGVKGERYAAKLALRSSVGDASLDGSVSLTPEKYDVKAALRRFNLAALMPDLGVGMLDGNLTAHGARFNPMARGANADVDARMATVVYNGKNLGPFRLVGAVKGGVFDVNFRGDNPLLDLALTANGTVSGNRFDGNLDADMNYVSLSQLGFMPDTCQGRGRINVAGNIDIKSLYCDLDLSVDDVYWQYGSKIYDLPHAFALKAVSQPDDVRLALVGEGAEIDAAAQSSLNKILASIPTLTKAIDKQIKLKDIDMSTLQPLLPQFTLDFSARGDGILSEVIDTASMHFRTMQLALRNDSLFSGDIHLMDAGTPKLNIDTLSLNFNQREKRLDYKFHMGNRPENLPEFADVNITGYAGGNRLSAYLRQRNAKGETGYRLGFTAAMLDSAISVRLTPLNATIAYKPWTINDDNYIQYGPGNVIDANLMASSGESSIALGARTSEDGQAMLDVGIVNLIISDFLNIVPDAPPITGALNTNMTLKYQEGTITGNGNLGIKELAWDKNRIGNVDLTFKGGRGKRGNAGARIGLLLDNREVLVAKGYLVTDTVGLSTRVKEAPTALAVEMKQFPLTVANAFLPADMLSLQGTLSGNLDLRNPTTAPRLNGSLRPDDAGIYVPMAGATFRIDPKSEISVEDNLLRFRDFKINAANENPVSIEGYFDARRLTDMKMDISLNGTNVALINNNRRQSQIYGKLFTTLEATARGSLSRLDIDAALSVLPATDIFYNINSIGATGISSATTTDVVKFVQFNDTTQVTAADSIARSSMTMDIDATLTIVNGAQATVNLSGNGTDKVVVSPNGSLSYTQNYMGDQRVNGTINVGSGMARYAVPLVGEKTFNFDAGSYVTFSGDMMNPTLHILATDNVLANVQQEGANSRLVHFDVGLSVLGTLQAPKVTFNLSTDEDITVSNELLGMTAEQRSAAAMNLLLYNTYTGPGLKASGNLSNPLFNFLEGKINSWAAQNIRGVNLSFGIDNYKQTVDGQSSNTMSYSYQISKSLFDNRFKIVVGGNYNTSAAADENFAQNLISDISFEYQLRQTRNTSMYLRLFRHTGYESILEGEVTETGVGFVYRRKLNTLRRLFNLFGHKKRRTEADSVVPISNDTIIHETVK